MTEFSIDWPHGHETRGGMPARVICTDRNDKRSIVALVTMEHGAEGGAAYVFPNGMYRDDGTETPGDLINKPAPMPVEWINIYERSLGEKHISRADANHFVSVCKPRVDCRAFTYRDGRIVDVTDEQA